MKLDPYFIRSQFPAFKEPSLKGWSFFENAGGSYTCQQVVDRLMEFYTKTKVQPCYLFKASLEADVKMNESYTQLAAYLNVDEEEINFGPSTTQNIYVLANALRPLWKEGDEIIVSNQDHEANAGSWRKLASTGIVVKEWTVDSESGKLDLDELQGLITDRTKMIAFPHSSNVIAHINPVRTISDMAHKVGAISVVDGVSYSPHGLPDLKELGPDIYFFSLYKTWGPHLGLMYTQKDILAKMANQSHSFNGDYAHYKITPAGPDHAQIASAAGMATYFDAVHNHHFDSKVDAAQRGRDLHQLFADHEKELMHPLMDFLKSRDDLRIIGPSDPEERAATISILPKNQSVLELATKLTDHKLMVGHGNFYGVRPLGSMNIDLETGVVRLSFVHYNTMEEIDQLLKGLKAALN
ncbi:MAG: aminotransferase class V-fold PLP-dependent enzyme [Flavobacteriales bacterium]|nr:aminotransferase class V-fold PLP-dependent enzyme [Flavobacteriales bacterium]